MNPAYIAASPVIIESGRPEPAQQYIPGEPLDPCVPKVWLKVLDFVLGATAVAIVIDCIKTFDGMTGDEDPAIKQEKMRIIASGVSSIGILLWPVLWDTLAGYSLLVHHPLTMFGFVWPMVVSTIDLTYAFAAKNAVAAERVFGIGQLSSDANTLVGVAFAVGSLLASQSNAVADATVPLLMYALVLLIAFIIPTPSLDPNGPAHLLQLRDGIRHRGGDAQHIGDQRHRPQQRPAAHMPTKARSDRGAGICGSERRQGETKRK